ncbi:secretogranin-2b [Hypomesus transpacificus]|uniref:secretogranin-2b n=1 Tax=Hypomesus transpacificus TaxID=137520 RepID=UPI001F082CA4|nr:secretogranin-2b [Hypomesus transpacificus]
MVLSHPKFSAGGVMVLVAFLLHMCAVQGASLPRYHRLRGGEGEERRPAAYLPPSSDMIKALEYIESLKQRKDGGREEPTTDYDEVEKFRVLLQLASLRDEGARDRQASPPAQKQDMPAEQLVRALLRTLQDQAGRDSKPAPVAPVNDHRAHRHHSDDTGKPVSAPADYGNFPRPHKKYPLMFEDEENRDAYKRATEDLEEQYTPQSLANLRSIFDELGRMSTTTGQKRDVFQDDDDDDEDMFSLRNLAYEDVAGGEEWVPMEEKVETEEVVNGSHEEFDRGLGETSDEQEEIEGEGIQRRATQDDHPDDDTKLVDYYLLKILEMSDQSQKRDNKKRLIRPSLIDPRTLNELLEMSLKLHIPPNELIDMLITEDMRKLDRQPQDTPRYRTNKPRVRYYSRRLPVKPAPEDMDREDFLNIIGVETISNEYPVRRPLKPVAAPARVPAPPVPAVVKAPPAPAKTPSSSGRRENLFLSELNKMPLKRQSDDNEDDEVDEDEVFLAAKILTRYPNSITKRDTQSQANGQFPYELYEQAMKDYFDQADVEKSTPAKRDAETSMEVLEKPTEIQMKDEIAEGTAAPQKDDGKELHGKPIGGM